MYNSHRFFIILCVFSLELGLNFLFQKAEKQYEQIIHSWYVLFPFLYFSMSTTIYIASGWSLSC